MPVSHRLYILILLFAGVPRCSPAPLLPSFMAALGLLPDPRSALRPGRSLSVHFCRDRGQLLLHTLAVAHPGGQLCGVPAATKGEGQRGVRVEQRLELDVELETPGLWVHAV